jgi:aspartate/methionine/tyrosine aminotransferase
MPINPFKLERYFAQYEFKVKYLLSSSDCESLSLSELLQLATPESLKLWNELKLGYTESPGHPLLRNEVARLYRNISPANVIVAAPEEAIFVAMHTLLSPGDHVVSVFPAYQSLYEIARSIGCSVTPWQFGLSEAGWQLDLHSLENALTAHTKLIVLNFPHNPTGYVLPRRDLETIVELARRHNLYIFSDEMYRWLEYDPAIRLPALCELYERGISLSGLSKSFALPGLRVGWLVTPERELIERWLAFKDYTTICNSAPGEILSLIALQAKDQILSRNLGIVRRNLKLAGQFFSEHSPLFDWLSPQAGSVAFPRWRSERSVEAFCQDLLDQQGVMIVPGSVFEFPGNHFRIGLGRRNLAEGLERVDDYLKHERSR